MPEKAQRFSESSLWQRQRTYFEEMGAAVWQKGIIPHYITTNPFLANAYSQVILGFLRDVPLNHAEPLYIIELGAGVGRLAHHFLQKFLPLLGLSPFAGLDIRYVLTDFASKTVDEWRTNATLVEWMAAGYLDYAQFDLEHPRPLNLLYSKQTLDPTKLANPLILIANYVFDSVPQDLFWVEDGKLEEYRVAVHWGNSTDEDEWSTDAELNFSKHPVPLNYYELPELNAILQTYQENLHQTVVSLPTHAITCLDYFCRDEAQAQLIICADKGYERLEDLAYRTLPELTAHGSFSLSVNFDAIRRFVKLRQGHVLQPQQRHVHLHVTAFVWNSTIRETMLAFYQAIAQHGPDEYFVLKSIIQEHYDELSFVQIMAWLRWTGWDAIIFLRLFERLQVLVNQINEEEEQELFRALERIAENYMNIGQEEDGDYCLGMLFFGIKAYEEALTHFQHSLNGYGADPTILCNAGICYFELGDAGQARQYFEETLAHEPNFQPAHDMLKVLQNGHK